MKNKELDFTERITMNEKNNRIRILYIDDEIHNLTVFKSAFRKDYEIYTATSPSIGEALLEQKDIQVILTDQKMPETTGIEFLDKVVRSYPNTIRILITGYSDINVVIDAVNRGRIHHYVTKPYKPENLKKVIDEMCMNLTFGSDQTSHHQGYFRSILNSHEEDREKFANSLHEGLAQQLSGVKFYLSSVNNDQLENQQLKDVLMRSDEIIDDSIRELRHMCFDLMPRSLNAGGTITDAISELCRRLRDIEVRLSFTAQGSLPVLKREANVRIYRMIRELVEYVIECYTTKEITCSLIYKNEVFLLSMAAPGTISKEKQMAVGRRLKNIQTKVELYNGHLNTIPYNQGEYRFEITLPFSSVTQD